MSREADIALIESVKLQRSRLSAALLFGGSQQRRALPNDRRRIMISIVVAAAICAGCVGVSFVTDLIASMSSDSGSTSLFGAR